MPGETTTPNPEESIYGANAITSGDLSEHDLAMIKKSQGAEVRDGDDFIEIDGDDEGEDDPEGNPDDTNEGDQKDEAGKDPKEVPKEGDAKIEGDLKNSQSALEDIGKNLTAKGVDVAAIEAELLETGALSEATYAKLAENGYPKAVADAILGGLSASQQAMAQSILAEAGGPEGFKVLTEFAAANSPDSITAYNEAVQRGDIRTAKVILQGLKGARTAKLGTANKQVSGKPNAKTTIVEGYKSRSDMTAAMKDPRYSRDAAYRASVEKRVAASTF